MEIKIEERDGVKVYRFTDKDRNVYSLEANSKEWVLTRNVFKTYRSKYLCILLNYFLTPNEVDIVEKEVNLE